MSLLFTTALPAGATTHAALGSFVSPSTVELVLARGNALEVHLLTPDEGLKLVGRRSVNGRVMGLERFRGKGRSIDSLLLTLDHPLPQLVFFSLSPDYTPVPDSSLALHERVSVPSDVVCTSIVDPSAGIGLAHVWQGDVRLFTLPGAPGAGGKKGKGRGARGEVEDRSVQIDQSCILSMCFIPSHASSSANPIFAALLASDNPSKPPYIRFRRVLPEKLDFTDPGDPYPDVEVSDHTAHRLVPVSALPGGTAGGVLVVGEDRITFYEIKPPPSSRRSSTKGKQRESIGGSGDRRPRAVTVDVDFSGITAHAYLDEEDHSQILLGDEWGTLHVLTLQIDQGRGSVSALALALLGRINSPTTLTYLGAGYLHVGSVSGDAQLVRLHAEPVAQGEEEGEAGHVEVVDSQTSLAPISDLVVSSADGMGQGQVVTCSGLRTSGSLRVVRSGVGVQELAEVDVPNATGVWPLRLDPSRPKSHSHILLSFPTSTRLFLAPSDTSPEFAELPPTAHAHIDRAHRTLAAGERGTVHVTPARVTLGDPARGEVLASWEPARVDGREITVADVCEGGEESQARVALSVQGRGIVLLEVRGKELVQVNHKLTAEDVSALSLTATHLAAGFWGSFALTLSDVPTLRPTLGSVDAPLAHERDLPRSLALSSLGGGQPRLLVGLGDGSLVEHLRGERRAVSLGSLPVRLVQRREDVVALSERPSIVGVRDGRLVHSPVNLKDVTALAPIHVAAAFEDAVVFVTPTQLRFARLDYAQKLQVRTVPLGNDVPRRIAHDDVSKVYAVGVDRSEWNSPTHDVDVQGAVCFFDAGLSLTARFDLKPSERVASLGVLSLAPASPHRFFVVGTAIQRAPDEQQCAEGRVLVFGAAAGPGADAGLVAEATVGGAVYDVVGWQGRLVVAVNSKVIAFNLALEAGAELQSIGSWGNSFIVSQLVAAGVRLVVGDYLRSAVVLRWKDGKFEEVARDSASRWITALSVLGEDDLRIIGADISFNVFALRQPSHKLETAARFQLGEGVSRFRAGSLASTQTAAVGHALVTPRLVYGTATGALGVVADVAQSEAEVLQRLQSNLAQAIPPIGAEYEEWRKYRSQAKVEDAAGVLDGDLLAQLLDLAPAADEMAVSGSEGADDRAARLKLALSGRREAEKLDTELGELVSLVEELSHVV